MPKTGKIINLKAALSYVFYACCLYLLFCSKIANLAPFAFAFFCALLYLKKNAFILFPIYCLTGFLSSFAPIDLLYFAVEGGLMLVFWVVHKYSKRELKTYLLPIYMLMAKLVFLCLYFSETTPTLIATRVVEVALSLIFCFAFVNGLRALLVRGLRFKSTVDELVSLCLILLALYGGIFGVSIYGVDISIAIGIFLLLLAGQVFGVQGSMILGGIFGLSGLIYNNSPVYLAAFALYALANAIFVSYNRILCALSVVLCELVLSYFFSLYIAYSYLNIIAIFIPVILFCCLPSRVIDELKTVFGGVGERTLSRYIVNRNKQEMSRRLLQMSDVFREMQMVYSGLIGSNSGLNGGIDCMVSELKQRTCDGCLEVEKCWRGKSCAHDGICELVENGLSKGKVTLMDLSDYLAVRCNRVTSLLQNANMLLLSHSQSVILTKNMDMGKTILSRQFGGVSEVFRTLAEDSSKRVVFNLPLEKRLIDELCYHNIVCNEIVISGEDYDSLVVHAVIREKDLISANISEIISRVCGLKMMMTSSELSEKQGWVVLQSKPMPKYDVVFGVSSVAKSGSRVSGDTHSMIKISEDKFMLCVCDGMGSGEDAERISSTSISLVENFYLAGFSNDVILNSVNKMLTHVQDDAFVAIDIAVMDLKNGCCDFIKIGASESYIKGKTGVRVVEGSSLPLGILEDITPWCKSEPLDGGDFVILLSDGVKECFGSGEDLMKSIHRINTQSAEVLADYLLDEAVVACEGIVRDDMTVVALKIYSKS